MHQPSYIRLYESGELQRRAEQALRLLNPCRLCPRECGVNRLEDEKGFCNTGRLARVANFGPHFGEEDPLVGRCGSGTIFIARSGCHNINFVTPSHVVPQLLEGLIRAIPLGLDVPLVYNSSGYEKVETLALIESVFDIYMPDIKFWSSKWADRYCGAPDYPDVAAKALREMHRQVGDLRQNKSGVAESGLLVRRLVMPGRIGGTEQIVKFLAEEISPDTYANLMDQYRPCGTAVHDEFIGRRLTVEEFREALEWARKAGLKRLDSRERQRIFFRSDEA